MFLVAEFIILLLQLEFSWKSGVIVVEIPCGPNDLCLRSCTGDLDLILSLASD